ncbi:MAG TPA: PfkB family carbohydrate kinase, partial [Thermodesulfovibrionia bacterium]|nr:PfkB family carbohydrate kinase [Thermodesulfovibrionia bacterium]
IPPAVTAVNTWGSGDCVVAGIAVYLAQGHSFEEAVRFGVAAGTANTLSYGAGFIKLNDVMTLYKSTQITAL